MWVASIFDSSPILKNEAMPKQGNKNCIKSLNVFFEQISALTLKQIKHNSLLLCAHKIHV